MGVLPVPDEIRAMVKSIDTMAAAIKEHSMWLEKIHSQMVEIKTGLDGFKEINSKLDSMHGTLTSSKDSIRMLCTLIERKGS
jgi:hypothetical protein